MILRTTGPEHTQARAAALGRLVHPGDILCLVGDLGTGKTTFTQGLALGMGFSPATTINSPTFTLIAEHREGRIPLFHFDVYRLAGPESLYDLAFDEYLEGEGVVVIEWADRILEAIPTDYLKITLTAVPGSDEREIIGQGFGPRSQELVEMWNAA